MKFATRVLAVAGGAMILASCGGGKLAGDLTPSDAQPPLISGVSDFPAKVGAPYNVGNVSYTP